MAYDKVILSAVLRQLEQTRSEHQADTDFKRQQLYTAIPRLSEIDKELQGTAANAVRVSLDSGKDPEQAINALKEKNLALQAQKQRIITNAGFPADYLTPPVNCSVCGDTGYVGGKLCSCVRRLYAKEQTKRLSTILPIKTDNFSSFNLEYYSDVPDSRTGVSPRSLMQKNFAFCRHYADHFSPQSSNILMVGSSGLGKTFLSSCIARVVSENGFSVAYDTAIHVFSSFESVKFNGEDSEQAAINLTKYRSADLLILDDLGTEMPSALNTSCLYELINTRLMQHKPMIINTNLTPSDLPKRYTAPIASRIMGEFALLRFTGEDIRMLRRMNNMR